MWMAKLTRAVDARVGRGQKQTESPRLHKSLTPSLGDSFGRHHNGYIHLHWFTQIFEIDPLVQRRPESPWLQSLSYTHILLPILRCLFEVSDYVWTWKRSAKLALVKLFGGGDLKWKVGGPKRRFCTLSKGGLTEITPEPRDFLSGSTQSCPAAINFRSSRK